MLHCALCDTSPHTFQQKTYQSVLRTHLSWFSYRKLARLLSLINRNDPSHSATSLHIHESLLIFHSVISLEYLHVRGSKRSEYFAYELRGERGEVRARERRNRTPGARCHTIIAFVLPFRDAKWWKRVPRFPVRATPSTAPTSPRKATPHCRFRLLWPMLLDPHGYHSSVALQLPLLCRTEHLYTAYQVSCVRFAKCLVDLFWFLSCSKRVRKSSPMRSLCLTWS